MTGKMIFWLAMLVALPTALLARDLHAIAKRERARRERLRIVVGQPVKKYDNRDLDRIHGQDRSPTGISASGMRDETHSAKRRREEEAERREREQFWRQERRRHDERQLRLSAKIERLEWRLNRRREQLRHASERLSGRDDPTILIIQSSLAALRAEHRKREEGFLERGRRAGALPGWLR